LNNAQKLLAKTFNRNELKQLLLFKMNLNLDDIAPNATGNKDLIFEVLTWMDRHGDLYDLIRFAAADRIKIPEWQTFVAEIASRLPTPPPPMPRRPDPLGEVSALVRGYLRLRRVLPYGDQRTVQLQAIVNQLLALPLEEYGLIDEFHLSMSGGERLVAVLTLVRRPDPKYLRWLSERLGVESNFVGYQAAIALRAAAQTLSQVDLDTVTDAVKIARELLKTHQNGDRARMLAEVLQTVTQRSSGARSTDASQ